MVKKLFTNPNVKILDDLSDVELIEELEKPTHGSGEFYNNVIKALLDRRLKRSIHDLTKNIRDGNSTAENYSKKITILTRIIAVLTFLMLAGLTIQIYLLLIREFNLA